jgi:hypothetical protein
MNRPRRKRRPADDNRRRRLEIIAELDRLLGQQLDPAFRGNVEILVPAKDGRIGEPQFTVKRFGRGPE